MMMNSDWQSITVKLIFGITCFIMIWRILRRKNKSTGCGDDCTCNSSSKQNFKYNKAIENILSKKTD